MGWTHHVGSPSCLLEVAAGSVFPLSAVIEDCRLTDIGHGRDYKFGRQISVEYVCGYLFHLESMSRRFLSKKKSKAWRCAVCLSFRKVKESKLLYGIRCSILRGCTIHTYIIS